MKKRIFLILMSVILVFSMCLPAMAYTLPTEALTNTSGLIASDAEQLFGVKGTPTVDGTVDDVWETAFPLNLGGSAPCIISVLWDETNLYILESRPIDTIVGVADSNASPNTWSSYDASLYNIVLPATMEANKVAAILFNIAPRDSMNSAAVGTTTASRIWVREAKITDTKSLGHSKDANLYTDDAIAGSVYKDAKSFITKTETGYVAETSIPWSALAHRNTATAEDTAYTGSVNDVIGIKFYFKHQGDGFTAINSAGNQTYHTSDGYTDNGTADVYAFSALNLVESAPIETDGYDINVTTADELKTVFNTAAQYGLRLRGYTINLLDDIDLNPGQNCSVAVNEDGTYTVPDVPEYVFPGLRIFLGTLDGHGHTLSGLYYEQRAGAASFMAPITYFGGTIKDIAIVNSTVMALHTSGSGTNLAAGCTIAGIAAYMIPYGTFDTVYADIDVWCRSWSGHNIAGLVGKVDNNPTVFRKVAFVGMVGGSQPTGTSTAAVDTSPGTKAAGLIYDANWKTQCLLDHVMVAPTFAIAGNATSNLLCYNDKFTTADMAAAYKPSCNVKGLYESYELAVAAGAVLDTVGGTPDYTYSLKVGGVIPTELVHMADFNLWCQQTEKYAADENDYVDVRLLSTVDSLDICDRIGFKVSVVIGENAPLENTMTTSTVYESIQAAGKTVTAEELGGAYITAMVVKGVPATGTVTITVTPVKVLDEKNYEDPVATVITVVDGAIVH